MSILQKHIHFEHNDKGHDYIVGDIHGMFDQLITLLTYFNFNENDRLFSVGDVIDRGPHSLKTLEEFLIQPNWHMIRGNHEHMMIMALLYNDQPHTDIWLNNGGDWINNPNQNFHKIADLTVELNKQPLIISVGHDDNRFNICHAELIKYNHYHDTIKINDQMIDDWTFDATDEDNILWGRQIYDSYDYLIRNNLKPKPGLNYHSNHLSTTFVGHTVHLKQHKPIQFEKHIFLDTGASLINHPKFDLKFNARLSIYSPTKQTIYTLNHSDDIEEFNINMITKINSNED